MDVVLRREMKYILKGEERENYINVFDGVLKRDSFSKNSSYKVRSLYFDTPYDKDFYEKINEQEVRKKVRIRIYSPHDKFAKLELKQKQDVFQKKRSLKITREDALKLMDGQYSVLLGYTEEFAKEMYTIMSEGCYKPKTVIEYDRLAFMAKENHIRITFDYNICSSELYFNIFDENLVLYPVMDKYYTILEVKYDKFMLGYIADIIKGIDKRPITSSKYCMGRNVTIPLLYV